METNQEKVKEIIGENSYNLLIKNGYIPVEFNIMETLLKHQEEIDKLNRRIDFIESIPD